MSIDEQICTPAIQNIVRQAVIYEEAVKRVRIKSLQGIVEACDFEVQNHAWEHLRWLVAKLDRALCDCRKLCIHECGCGEDKLEVQ